MKWISVKEQDPPVCEWVLVGGINESGNWLVTIARITCGEKKWGWFNDDEERIEVPYSDGFWGPLHIKEISHWMDIPESPDNAYEEWQKS